MGWSFGLVLNRVLKAAVLEIILAHVIYVKPDVGSVGPIDAADMELLILGFVQSQHLTPLNVVN